jgi:hypothetical protein
MFTEKLMGMVKRQTALVAKGEELTADERKELDKLNAAIAAVTSEDGVQKGATKLTTMTADEFEKYCTEAMASDLDAEALAVLKSNVEAVKAQKADGKEIFAVELPVAKSIEDKMADRIEELEKRLAAVETNKGEPEPAPAGDSEGEGEGEGNAKGATADMANEILDGLVKQFESLKTKINNGTLTKEDIDAAFDAQWETREFLDLTLATMGKVDTLKALLDELKPIVEKMAKDEPATEGDDANGEDGNPEPNAKSNEDFDDDDSDADDGLCGIDLAAEATRKE